MIIKEFINNIKNKLDVYFSKDDQVIITDLKAEITDLKLDKVALEETLDNFNIMIDELQQEAKTREEIVLGLMDELEKLKAGATSELEDYWNNKITPSKAIYYPARNGNNMNVIRFFSTKNDTIPKLSSSSTNDKKANDILKYVNKIITYKSDMETKKVTEFWQYADETYASREGDCEDGAILIANLMVKAGIPYWRIRLNAGDVQGGGHAYVTYLAEKDNKWYVMDWCYWPSASINYGQPWAEEAKKYFGIWFSWNAKYGFKKAILDRTV